MERAGDSAEELMINDGVQVMKRPKNGLRMMAKAPDSDQLEILGFAAHELKNPLFSIRLAARRLLNLACPNNVIPKTSSDNTGNLDFDSEAITKETRLLCSDIDICLTHLFTTIDQMLDSSRLGHGMNVRPLEKLCIREQTERVISRFRQQMLHKNINSQIFTEQPSVYVMADSFALDHVLDNLISNAIKFSPAGHGIRIDISQHCNSRTAIHYGQLCISDQGPGIKTCNPKILWGKFERLTVQAAKMATDGTSSTGLGLTLCKQLVKQMYGRMDCRNLPTGGACFSVQLPLAQLAAA